MSKKIVCLLGSPRPKGNSAVIARHFNETAENMGAEVYSSVVIPRPHQDLGKIVTRYSLTNLLPQEE